MGLLKQARRLQKAQQIEALKMATDRHISLIETNIKALSTICNELDADDDFTPDEVSEVEEIHAGIQLKIKKVLAQSNKTGK